MAKTIETVLSELGLTVDSPIEDILDKLNEYLVISENEKANVRSASVYTLPSVVRNSEQELKQKMYGIVTDDNKGAAALINKRTVLLSTLIGRIKELSESNESRLNAFDLGELQQDPFSTNNTVLNAITSIGLYKFTYSNQSYLMLVDDGTSITQTVIYYGGVGFIQFFHRILTATTCSVSSKKTLALSDKVAMDIYNAKEEVYENVYKKPQTYSRDEALAIGLIEVSEYDAKTGEITVTYNPNTVDVTYDEDTGELIFSQKTYLLDSGALPKKIRTLKLGLSEAEINNIKNSVTEDIDTLRNQLSNGAFRVKYAGTADVAKTAQTAGLTTKNEPIASKEDLKAYDEAKNIVSAIKKYVNADGSLKAKYDGNGNQIDTTYATQKMLTDLIGGAPESYNTLKEIADYINQDKSGASSMLSSIQNNASNIIKNSNDIAELDQKIADVESNIVQEIAEALAGEY